MESRKIIAETLGFEINFDNESDDCDLTWSQVEDLMNLFNNSNQEINHNKIHDLSKNLSDGRDYLMQVEPDEITVENSLEAFGFGRNGLNSY